MKQSPTLLLPILLCVGLPAMAQAVYDIDKVFAELDTDRDGYITTAEVRAHSEPYFKTMDRDGNGLLDTQEIEADNVRVTGMRLPPDLLAKALAGTYQIYDFDGDGRADMESYVRSQNAMMMTADFNKDGRVSLEEKRALHEQRPPRTK